MANVAKQRLSVGKARSVILSVGEDFLKEHNSLAAVCFVQDDGTEDRLKN